MYDEKEKDAPTSPFSSWLVIYLYFISKENLLWTCTEVSLNSETTLDKQTPVPLINKG